LRGGPEPRVLASDGATAVYLAEAARASMETGQVVDMKTFVSTGAVA
jgi:myo-inositol 2-dehydrogenase/D-chiro-inositol 1-dehydrogenase